MHIVQMEDTHDNQTCGLGGKEDDQIKENVNMDYSGAHCIDFARISSTCWNVLL